MAKLEVTEFTFTSDSLIVRFMSKFVVDDTLRFYMDQGLVRCENKHMSREFVQSVLVKIGESLILDGMGD